MATRDDLAPPLPFADVIEQAVDATVNPEPKNQPVLSLVNGFGGDVAES